MLEWLCLLGPVSVLYLYLSMEEQPSHALELSPTASHGAESGFRGYSSRTHLGRRRHVLSFRHKQHVNKFEEAHYMQFA